MKQMQSLAKITAPRLPAVFPRRRLFKLLDQGRRAPVTWISAHAGSGKTTLIKSWIDSRKHSCVWYQLDPGDADLSTFFYYLGMAGRKAAPRIKQPLPLLTPEYLPDVPTFSRRYFENLCGRVNPPFVLVFDNYQDVPVESAFHAVLASGIAALPEGVRMVLVSRFEPPPAFSGLLAGSKMELFGRDELQLTPVESAAIVRLHSRDRQDAKTLQWMYDRTKGWAAGLVLLARAAKVHLIEPGKVDALPPEKVFEYFANELFARTDEAFKVLLVKTAVLPTMAPAMAEQLTGNGDAGSILEGLNRRNYFVYKRNQPSIAYQYHPLFRDFLLSRVKELFGEAGAARLRKQAAGLLERAGQIEDAAGLYIETKDWEGLARLVVGHAGSLFVQGRGRTIEEWLNGIPGETILRDPQLLFWSGISQMSHDLRESRLRLEQAYALFKKRGEASGLYLSWAAIVETFVFEWSDFHPLDHWISEIEVLLREHPEFPSPEIEARVASAVFCALMYRQPHHKDLPAWEERVRRISDSTEDFSLKLTVCSHLVFYYTWWNGEQATAAMLVNRLRSAVRSVEISPLSKIAWQAIEAACSWMTGDNEACLAAVREGLRIAGETGVRLWDFMLLAQASFATLTAGDLDGARSVHERMAFISGTGRKLDIAHYHYHLGWEAMCRADFPLALEHMKTGLKAAEETGEPFIAAFISMGVAEVLIELGDFKKAKRHLDEARRIGVLMRSNTVEYQYSWIEAVRCLREGDRKKALGNLRRHLAVSREFGILNHAAWRSSVMVPLYALALEEGIEIDHVRALIKKRKLTPPDAIEKYEASSPLRGEGRGLPSNVLIWGAHWPWPLKINTLGRFELLRDDREVNFSGKVQKKPLEMLKALIAFGGRNVGEERIIDALWPDAEGHLGHKSFETTLQRLRRLLGNDAALRLQDGQLTLDVRLCWVDAWAFEEAARSAECGMRSEQQITSNSKSAIRNPNSEMEKAISLYRGHFLPADTRLAWSAVERERLRGKFLRAVVSAGEAMESAGKWRKACEYFEQGIEKDAACEEFYQHLMICRKKLGQEAGAAEAYKRCRMMLSHEFGLEPSSRTEEIRQSLTRIK